MIPALSEFPAWRAWQRSGQTVTGHWISALAEGNPEQRRIGDTPPSAWGPRSKIPQWFSSKTNLDSHGNSNIDHFLNVNFPGSNSVLPPMW